jgi:hypothetical protein
MDFPPRTAEVVFEVAKRRGKLDYFEMLAILEWLANEPDITIEEILRRLDKPAVLESSSK